MYYFVSKDTGVDIPTYPPHGPFPTQEEAEKARKRYQHCEWVTEVYEYTSIASLIMKKG